MTLKFIDWNNILRQNLITWDTIIDPEKIEEILISRNNQHLGETQGAFFTTLLVTKFIGIDV